MPGTAALNDEMITNNTLTHVGDQPAYSAMPPITPAIMRLFGERCNFANLAKSNTSLFSILVYFLFYFSDCLTYIAKTLSCFANLRISISIIQDLSVEGIAVLCEFMLLKLTLICHSTMQAPDFK